ncbi:MAG: hypothetical protein MJ057_01235 [Sphaerochaetaceae bacterium]|nr:hypothetical protein [Sphaerochaetaceae bacterium]
MKKVITVFAIMMVLVSAVFAAEAASDAHGTAKINIDTLITAQYPAYQLEAKTVSAGAITTATSDVAGTPTAGLVTITDDTLLKADATVTFAINQIKTSKCFHSYDLTVTATDLILMNAGKTAAATKTDVGMDDDEFAAAVKSFAVNDSTPTITAADNIASLAQGVARFSAEENKLTAKYLGGIKIADGKVEEVGTFSCTWAKNELAIPGPYQATVTLTVTTTV